MTTPISLRALNRATLARQLLLARSPLSPVEAVHRLFAMQAQLARPPFIGLWSRLEGFERDQLIRAVHARELVRATHLRATLHLMTAADFQAYRATIQPVLDAGFQGILKTLQKQRGASIPDLGPLVEAARLAFEARPRPFEPMRQALLEQFPDADDRAMGYAVRTQLPLVQVPTDAEWGWPGTADFATARSWLGAPVTATPDVSGLVRRYLAAFGPATPKDMQIWSGLPAASLKPVFEAMRGELVTFKDPRGRELFDLPDAPRPAEDTPAPVRFMPDFDNLVLSHDDRTRIGTDDHRARIYAKGNLRVFPFFLVDGFVAGTWKVEKKKGTATLTVTPFEPLDKATRSAIADEGEMLARFSEPVAKAHGVTIE
jgi:hypothetical protein